MRPEDFLTLEEWRSLLKGVQTTKDTDIFCLNLRRKIFIHDRWYYCQNLKMMKNGLTPR
jgi:hypothetical protein